MSARDVVHLTSEQLDDYVDGLMDSAARASAEAHLATCVSCRHSLDETRALLATATRERTVVRAPAELWPLVASSTVHLAAVRRQVLASMRGVLITGAIALVAATAVITWKVARWTAARDAPVMMAPPSGGAPGRHAGHVGHPTIPVPPRAPDAPRAPSP